MFSDHRSRKPFIVALTVSVVVLLLVLGTQFALANKEAVKVAQIETKNAPNGYGDGDALEVGVEWINDFPGTADDRSHWDESCDGLYYHLAGLGWTPRFRWTDWNVWETDAKKESLGGQEDTYVDNVDIAMICTHGSSAYDNFWGKSLSSVYYGTTHTDQNLSPGDAYKSYGDKDLEWLAFDSCSVLSDGTAAPYYNRGYWAASMDGLRLLLGFKNTMYVNAPGDGTYWADFMTMWPYSFNVTQAWFLAADYNQPPVTCARVLAEDSDNFNDHLWGYGHTNPYDSVVDNNYWYWDHCSSGAKPVATAGEQPDAITQSPLSEIQQTNVITMPVVQVLDRIVDDDYVRRIGGVLDMTGTIGSNDMFKFMVDTSTGITRTLLVDPITGSYSFHDLSRLWTMPMTPPVLPNEDQAIGIIETWLKMSGGDRLPSALYRNAGHMFFDENIYNDLLIQSENGDLQDQPASTTPADAVMTYPRLIPAKAGTINGIQQVNFPMFGPGAHYRVYLGDAGEIIGLQGGSRDILVTGAQVNILDPGEAWAKLRADPNLAIPSLPLVSDTFTYTMATLGYYEMPYLQHQSELIPVWEFNTNFFANGVLVESNVPVYVPAADEYMPPEVSISSPVDGSSFMAGETIYFEGTATGGLPPYTYEWTASGDGFLGNALTLSTELTSPVKDGSIYTQNVSFQVTDANGMSSTATITVNILSPYTWIPFLNK